MVEEGLERVQPIVIQEDKIFKDEIVIDNDTNQSQFADNKMLDDDDLYDQAPAQEPELSEEEQLRKLYEEELAVAQLDDPELEKNMREMMNMGYFNYKVNYNLLKRNKNDLSVAVQKLCNYSITDTMFEIKKQ